MKKFLSFIIAFLMCFGVAINLVGCNWGDDDKINIICTIFPEYDWVKNIVGEDEDFNVSILLDDGVDLHSYQPTISEIAKIAKCDMFVYVGGESDDWAEGVLAQKTNKNMKIINLLDILGDDCLKEEEIEGAEPEGEGEEDELDEHVWLSLKNAQTICNHLAQKLGELKPDAAQNYLENCATYCESLNVLDVAFSEDVASAQNKTLLFADRFPFRYLFEDYDLNYYAAFSGCSSETEASVATISFLVGKVNELNLKYILTCENNNNEIANTIKSESTAKNQTITFLNSLQSTTSADAQNGASYYLIMQDNLNTIRTILGVD